MRWDIKGGGREIGNLVIKRWEIKISPLINTDEH
jgi:hypothetical protein